MHDNRRARLLSTRTVFHGRIFSVTVDEVELPHGRPAKMEVLRHPGSVVLVPMPDPEHVILIRQYRYALDRWIWELPAGSLAPGEDAEEGARRECEEELGLVPAGATRLLALYPTPGYCDELMIFFKLTGLAPPETRQHQPDEDELIEARTFSLDEARALIPAGDVVDMKTVTGLSMIGPTQ